MAYTLGLIPIATGPLGEIVHAIIHTDEGEILSQMEGKITLGTVSLMPFSIDGFPHIHEAVDLNGTTRGYLIEEETTVEELRRFFESRQVEGERIAVDINGLYMAPLTVMSLNEHPLFDEVIRPLVYMYG
jgi:hypothetical protein